MKKEPGLRLLKMLVIVMGILLAGGGTFLLIATYNSIQEIQKAGK